METAQQIAIIGCAGRFPGATDVDALWSMVWNGGTSFRLLQPAELKQRGLPLSQAEDADFVPVANDLQEYQCFDAPYFGFTDREAEVMDPQRRILFECVQHAFEDAAQVPGAVRTGCYLSTALSEYFLLNIGSRPELFQNLGGALLGLLNGQDFAATHVAYKLDLHGPAINVNTARCWPESATLRWREGLRSCSRNSTVTPTSPGA
jgi:acyl transferase domain-containing protein